MLKQIDENKTLLAYFGVMSDDLTSLLIGVIDNSRSDDNTSKTIQKRIPVLIAECFQNIVRHKEDSETTRNYVEHQNFFQLSIEGGWMIISTVNLVKRLDVQLIKNALSNVNALSLNELKDLKRKILSEESLSEKGGAGLGLIDMAYKSKQPLLSDFVELDEKYSQFFLSTAFPLDNEKTAINKENNIKRFQNEYELFVKNSILLVYNGEFTKESTSFIIEILHENFAENSNIKYIPIFIEAIQNVSKHGKRINGINYGILSIAMKGGMKKFVTGNFVDKKSSEKLIKTLDVLKKTSIAELNSMYANKILFQDLSVEGDAGLGLIEVARQSNQNFDYSINQLREELYFSLEINLD